MQVYHGSTRASYPIEENEVMTTDKEKTCRQLSYVICGLTWCWASAIMMFLLDLGGSWANDPYYAREDRSERRSQSAATSVHAGRHVAVALKLLHVRQAQDTCRKGNSSLYSTPDVPIRAYVPHALVNTASARNTREGNEREKEPCCIPLKKVSRSGLDRSHVPPGFNPATEGRSVVAPGAQVCVRENEATGPVAFLKMSS